MTKWFSYIENSESNRPSLAETCLQMFRDKYFKKIQDNLKTVIFNNFFIEKDDKTID
jgi:hypothetical protein